MSFKLSKAMITQRDDIMKRLGDALGNLEAAIEEYNTKLEELKEPVETALTAYNNLVSEAREFADDIASQADADISDKSEKWQESERGQAAIEFKDNWETLSLDDIEIEFPEELSVDAPNHIENLENMPEGLEA